MSRQHSIPFLLSKARRSEEIGGLSEAAEIYERIIKQAPMEAVAHNRLMVLTRREKDYRKELRIIQQAIAAHTRHAQENQQAWLRSHKKTARLAKALVKSLGLTDRKGLPVVENRQLANWRKRLQVVKKRLAA
jgi:tetratricopeptide (TPR) repeat protein